MQRFRRHPLGNVKTPAEQGFCVERVTGIEPAWPAWKAEMRLISHGRTEQ